MQFSQGTKSNTEPFFTVRWSNHSNQNILCQNNSDDHGFLLGGEEEGVDFGCKAFANSIKLNRKKEFDGI